MKTTVKRAIRDQEGNVLILVLVLLLVGGLILTPLLGLMSTGLAAGQVYEKKTAELYAADAGVEDAIWKIQNNKAAFDEDYYTYPDPEQGVAELWVVNDKSVVVEIYREEMLESTQCHQVYRYQILSTATSDDGGATMIEAYLIVTTEFVELSGLMDNIITIKENLADIDALVRETDKVNFACREGCSEECCGAVYDYDDDDACYGCGVVYNYGGFWPSPSMLSGYYLADVSGTDPYTSDTLLVQDYPGGVGPLYRNGTLDIVNTGAKNLTLQLNDTVYITGDTKIGKTSHDFILDLNGNTIFVESPSQGEGNEALKIGGGVTTVLGPGAIIAIGDIYVAPDGDVGSNEEPVFIFSISGTVRLQPSGDFYGAIAGDFYVKVQPGQDPTLTYPPGGFGDDFDFFPSMIEVDRTYHIASWTIGPA